MKTLVTGGAGFIGRWVVGMLIDAGHDVWVVDNFVNGHPDNLKEFKTEKKFRNLVEGDIASVKTYRKLKSVSFDICYHLAARVVVQDSIDHPGLCFTSDVAGVFQLLEFVRRKRMRLVFVSSCMVYDLAKSHGKISETHPVKPASPYAAYKLAGEHMSLAWGQAYRFAVTVLRPFNTYGPFQKSTGEGGVISIFLSNALDRKPLGIYGSGNQTRDFLYVEDCARFICRAGISEKGIGEIVNAGSGEDISVNSLARLIAGRDIGVVHKKHIHPQSEIMKLICDAGKAKRLFGWSPSVPLEEGIAKTREWMVSRKAYSV